VGNKEWLERGKGKGGIRNNIGFLRIGGEGFRRRRKGDGGGKLMFANYISGAILNALTAKGHWENGKDFGL